MNLERFINELEAEYYAWGSITAYPKEPRRYIDVLDRVQGMTTPSTMHVLNFAVSCLDAGECYLEAGTWRGATFIGAMLGNGAAQGYAIDNDVMDEHDKDGRRSGDVWEENIRAYHMWHRSHYIEGTIPSVLSSLSLPPVGVYLFDGDKATPDAAYEGLKGVVPFLAPRALIIIDDANTPQIRQAAYMFCHFYSKACKLHDFPTPMNCWPSFWNGLMTIAWGVSLYVGEEEANG